MMMDKGRASEYKGKSLSEININPEEAEFDENDSANEDDPALIEISTYITHTM